MGKNGRRPLWFLRRRREAVREEIDEELRTHLQMRADELVAQGYPPADAGREALRRFGDVGATQKYCERQDVQKEHWKMNALMIEEIAQDLRISFRSLLRAPVLTATIVATVGLGIGATTTIFAAVNAALLRPLPYADPDRLFRLYTDSPPFQ